MEFNKDKHTNSTDAARISCVYVDVMHDRVRYELRTRSSADARYGGCGGLDIVVFIICDTSIRIMHRLRVQPAPLSSTLPWSMQPDPNRFL